MTNEVEKSDLSEKDFKEKFNELFEIANQQYPDLQKEIEVFTSHQIELESYQSYLNLINQPPSVVTSNTAT